MSETLLHVTARARGPARLDDPELDAPDPPIAALATRAASITGPLVLAGGEPTLRADLPEVLGALRGATLRTDALVLASVQTLRELRAAGLGTLRVVLHSARPDAHDWLVGQPGAAKRAMRALLAAADAGIPTEIEATLTRPTASHVAELVVLAEGVRARVVHLVRLAHRGVALREAIMLAPRFGLLEDPLDDAWAAATRARLSLHVHDLPRCVAPKLGAAIGRTRAHAFVEGTAWAAIAASYAQPQGPRCPSCPGAEVCAGAPADYVARFGSGEIVSESRRVERPHAPAPPGVPTSVPARAGRAPTTRVRDVRAIVRRGEVEGDPLIDRPAAPLPVLRVSFGPVTTSTRVLRARMIRAAQEGSAVLRIAGGLDHPAAPALLREAAHLPGPEVEVAGDATPLFSLTDADVFELQGIARVRAALLDPSAVAATLTFLERLTRIAKIETSVYVVLRTAADAAAWRDAFASLPGTPSVRVLDGSAVEGPLAPAVTHAAAPPAFVDAITVDAPVFADEP